MISFIRLSMNYTQEMVCMFALRSVGNGGLRKTQGEGATFTAVPIAFNGRIGGSFNVLSSGTKTGGLSNIGSVGIIIWSTFPVGPI